MRLWLKPYFKHLFIGVFCSLAITLKAEPPKWKNKLGNSFLLHTLSKYVLIDYSKGLLKDVANLDDDRKSKFIATDENATVAILLYEFSTGFGPSTRYFVDGQPFTEEIKTGPAMQWVLSEYLEGGEQDMYNVRYQFSPLYFPLKLNICTFAASQHIKTLSAGNLSQFVIGSFNADISSTNDLVMVHLWNNTSKRSLYWGLGKRLQRPLPFGSIKQHVYLTFTKAEILHHVNR